MGILVLLTYIALRSYALDVSRITKFLPRRPSAESIKQNLDHEPDVMAIDDEAADEVFSTLSSATARSILTALYDQPRTASELADEGETSLQNVQYHLNNLSESGLIEVVETWESDQRREMKVYAPTNKALVLFAGDNLHRSSLLDTIKQLVGLVGIFALVSVIVDSVVRNWVSRPAVDVGTTKTPGEPTMFALPPGLLFFLGSLLALFAFGAWWYYRSV